MFRPSRLPLFRLKNAFLIFVAALIVMASGCKYIMPVDTAPLDAAGVSYDGIQQMKALKITTPEVAEIAKAKSGHISDDGCVELLKTFHSRNAPFDAGDAAASLIQVGSSEDTVLQLAKLNQLGLGTGELQAMRLAGLPDEILLVVASHRAAGKPVLSGASLARLKNTGLRESTLLELAQRGVPESEANAIISSRRSGANDAEVLRQFAGS